MSSACKRKTNRCLARLVIDLALWAVYAEAMLGGALFLLCCAYFRATYWISAFGYPLAPCLVLSGLLCFSEYLRGCEISYGLGTEFLAHLTAIVGWVAYMGI